MKYYPFSLFFIFIVCTSVSHTVHGQDSFTFPDDCLGEYKGTLYIDYLGRGIVDSASVELTFSKTDEANKWNYSNVIDSPKYGKVEKLYTLIQKDSFPDVYVLDENNGLLIDHARIGRGLYSMFEVSGSLLSYKLECIDEETIYYEIFSVRTAIAKESSTPEEAGQVFTVKSYLPFTTQYVTLKKQ